MGAGNTIYLILLGEVAEVIIDNIAAAPLRMERFRGKVPLNAFHIGLVFKLAHPANCDGGVGLFRFYNNIHGTRFVKIHTYYTLFTFPAHCGSSLNQFINTSLARNSLLWYSGDLLHAPHSRSRFFIGLYRKHLVHMYTQRREI